MKIDLSVNREILAVVTLDHAGLMVAKSAAALALKSQRRLRLVTVCDESQISDKTESGTADALHQFGLFVDNGINVRSSVVDGRYPSALLELAAAHQSILMVVGQKAGSDDALNHTIELMAGASMPVLVIPDTVQNFICDESGLLHVLVADDLKESSQAAIECLTDFIHTLRLQVNVLHVHVEPVEVKTLALSPDFELNFWPELAVRERPVEIRYETIMKTLRLRSRHLADVVSECGGTYHAELWHGDVSVELNRAAQSHRASMIIFGKHHLVHKHPWAIGQMDYQKMLNLNRPIMMAPELS